MKDIIYDHYIAIDWAAANMAIARMTKKSNKISVVDVPADIKELQLYLKSLKGTIILAIEEGDLLQLHGNEAAAEKSVGPKGELFDLKRKTPCYLRQLFL